MRQILLIVFIVFIVSESNVLLVKQVNAGCVATNSNVECKSVTELSDRYFNESLKNLQDVRRLNVRNNGTELVVHSFSFRYFINLEIILIQTSRIQKIFADTFRDLPLKTLFIYYNNIREIYPGAFLNLSSLQKLTASNNRLKSIPRGVFKDLPKLNTLTLSKNEISSIDDSALENLPLLSKLHLDNNKIGAIVIHKVVSHPEQLEILWIYNNSLKILTNFMLQKLTKLKLLNLGFNEISIIEANTFEQTPLLETLILTNNKLKEVDGNVFPKTGLIYLQKLYLDNNELMFLSTSFFFRLHSLKKITLVGNPWLCTCLDFIYRILAENEIMEKCQNSYVTGQRPICVNEDVTSKVCSNKYDQKLSDIYMDHRRMFPDFTRPISCIL